MSSRFDEEGKVTFSIDNNTLEQPWGKETIEVNGDYYGLATYQAPEDLSSMSGVRSNSAGLDKMNLEVAIEFDASGEVTNKTAPLTVVRPPVVLVHGTLSNPADAWMTAATPFQSMYDVLSNSGFKVYMANYEESNGSGNPSGLDYNKMVVWGDEGEGGIQDALKDYRDNLEYAVTQADVVGHDMGGLLARVYASDHEGGYNPDYKRQENFMEGDINRLVTLATPHYGSEFREFQVFLEESSSLVNLPDFTLMTWLYQNALVFYYWSNGLVVTDAVVDQVPPPGNGALSRIGETDIPSHAITCHTPFGQGILKNKVFDPQESYYDLYWYTTLLLYNNKAFRDRYLDQHKIALLASGQFARETISGRNASELVAAYEDIMYFKQMVEDGLWYAGQVMAVLDGTWTLPAATTILKYAFAEVGMSNYTDPLLDVASGNLSGVASKYFNSAVGLPTAEDVIKTYLSTNDKSMEVIRSLIFDNDLNDGIVRVQSQTGGLEKIDMRYVTHLDTILHAMAPRDPEVQDAVVDLLKNGMESFREEGFPEMGDPLKLYYPDSVLNLISEEVGDKAICRSGMVPSHARAFANVADRENLIVITRPVNPDGTKLIACDNATKVMNVKPKSSNWGPQKGYLPQLQRYSKIWQLYEGDKRIETIMKYDQKVEENIEEMIAMPTPLQVSTCNEIYDVYIDKNEYTPPNDWEGAVKEIVLVRTRGETEEVCLWNPNSKELEIVESTCRKKGPTDNLEPFMVMATLPDPENDKPSIPLTADYDLLMFGFYEGEDQGPPDPPSDLPFDKDRGQITDAQKDIIDKLNLAVANTGYKGGNVSHHGPENQFSQSPYIDYPVTAFVPSWVKYGVLKESTGGNIITIGMGPPGFRDIYLKRFINAMRAKGFDLYDNPTAPGWHWTWDPKLQGYLLEDSDQIGAYVEEIKNPDCEKLNAGEPVTDCACPKEPAQDISNDEPSSWLFGLHGDEDLVSDALAVYPNPIESGFLNIDISSTELERVTYLMYNSHGKLEYSGTINLTGGKGVPANRCHKSAWWIVHVIYPGDWRGDTGGEDGLGRNSTTLNPLLPKLRFVHISKSALLA